LGGHIKRRIVAVDELQIRQSLDEVIDLGKTRSLKRFLLLAVVALSWSVLDRQLHIGQQVIDAF